MTGSSTRAPTVQFARELFQDGVPSSGYATRSYVDVSETAGRRPACDACRSCSLRATIAWLETNAPDDKTIADAFFAVGATLAKPRKNGARVVEWEISGGDSSFSTNAHLAKWIWRAMRVLQAIHARFPIASVELNGFR